MNQEQQNQSLAQTYNDIPYTSHIFKHCQPERLHALATLKGLTPAPVETAKVLEIGCSFGGNIVPFAIRHPKSLVVGVDLSERQIEVGQSFVKHIGINNVELVAGDISKIGFNVKFDYIICHGVFSWVPEFVQDAILATVQNYLSPNGIAFISYNTYPGWHIKDMAKELMLFGSNPELDRLTQVNQSFEMLNFTKNIFDRKNHPCYQFASSTFSEITNKSKYYIAHEFFENYNIPLYFRDFMRKAEAHQLSYVTDSNSPVIYDKLSYQDDEFAKVCHYFNNRVEAIEQYNDFIDNKTFRCTLLTHKENLISNNVNNTIQQYNNCQNVQDLYIHTKVRFNEAKDGKRACWKIENNTLEFWQTDLSDLIFNKFASTKDMVCVRDIIKDAEKLPNYSFNDLGNILWYIINAFGVSISYTEHRSKKISKKPRLFKPYQNLIEFVYANPQITSLSDNYGNIISVNFLATYLAQYLDGKNTIKDLMKIIRNAIEKDLIQWSRGGEKLTNVDISDDEIKKSIQSALDLFENSGYFNHY